MLGMVAGWKLGIAKRVKPILVRVPRRRDTGHGATAEDYLAGVGKLIDIFAESSQSTRAIVSLSWNFNQERYIGGLGGTPSDPVFGPTFELDALFPYWQMRLQDLLKSLVERGFFVVTGSGNEVVVRSTVPRFHTWVLTLNSRSMVILRFSVLLGSNTFLNYWLLELLIQLLGGCGGSPASIRVKTYHTFTRPEREFWQQMATKGSGQTKHHPINVGKAPQLVCQSFRKTFGLFTKSVLTIQLRHIPPALPLTT
jgi:hypothetical protein